MITISKLDAAMAEAERFLAAANAAKQRLTTPHDKYDLPHITGCKETGAVRRASLDLTRKLADLRSSKWEEA